MIKAIKFKITSLYHFILLYLAKTNEIMKPSTGQVLNMDIRNIVSIFSLLQELRKKI